MFKRVAPVSFPKGIGTDSLNADASKTFYKLTARKPVWVLGNLYTNGISRDGASEMKTVCNYDVLKAIAIWTAKLLTFNM